MSIIELKQAIDALEESDRTELSAYLIQLGRERDVEWQQRVQLGVDELKEGQGVSESQLQDALSKLDET